MPLTVAWPSSRTTPSNRPATSARWAVAASSSWARRVRAAPGSITSLSAWASRSATAARAVATCWAWSSAASARHLQGGEAPDRVVGRLVQGGQEGQQVARGRRAVHVALQRVRARPGATSWAWSCSRLGRVLPERIPAWPARGQLGVGLLDGDLQLADLAVQPGQLAGHLVDRGAGVGWRGLRSCAAAARPTAAGPGRAPSTRAATTTAVTSAPRRTVEEPTGDAR